MQAYTLDSVAFGYPGRPVFRDLSLTIHRSGVTALVGNNGSGKSTLLSLLAGIENPHAGRVRAHLPDRPALVVQQSAAAAAFPVTVRGAVSMGRWGRAGLVRPLSRSDRRAVERAMDRMDIRSLAAHPLGELSGGQRQRALVAQGLAQEARILLLDEPDAGLDQYARELITEVLRIEAARGVTVVQATHDLVRARAAEHCLLLAGGQASEHGNPRNVSAGNGIRFEQSPDFP